MMKSISRSPTTSIDLYKIESIYVTREENCLDRCFQYFFYYCCSCCYKSTTTRK
jgi:hypothetical protein